MPFLQEIVAMLFNKSHDLIYLDANKTASTLKNHRIKPNLGDATTY
jgi:hypothetical protein